MDDTKQEKSQSCDFVCSCQQLPLGKVANCAAFAVIGQDLFLY